MGNTAIYRRVSTADQNHGGQEHDLLGYVKLRRWTEPVAIYRDTISVTPPE